MFCLGGLLGNGGYLSDILEFDINKQEWTQNNNMTYAARDNGVSEVDFAYFEPWCQKRSQKTPILPVPGKKGDDAAKPANI